MKGVPVMGSRHRVHALQGNALWFLTALDEAGRQE
jgi:hypothetical protein